MRRRFAATVALVAVGLIGVGMAGCAAPDYPPLSQVLSPVCEGHGLQQAAAYTAGSDPSPIYICVLQQVDLWDVWDLGLEDDQPEELPPEWRPEGPGEAWHGNIKSIKDLQLVACVVEEQTEYGTCGPYRATASGGGVTIPSYWKRLQIRLVEARTGKEVASRTFVGDYPTCPYEIFAETTHEIRSPSVGFQEVEQWLRGYVMGDEQ